MSRSTVLEPADCKRLVCTFKIGRLFTVNLKLFYTGMLNIFQFLDKRNILSIWKPRLESKDSFYNGVFQVN